MLDQSTRAAILRLHDRGSGLGARAIASALGISRGAVKKVLKSGNDAVPSLHRAELADPHRDAILGLYAACKGNLVRVHEELIATGAKLSYQALTAFCRRNEIGHEPPLPAGQYEFEPGVEMQHDTSPHRATIGGRDTPVQSASLVLGYSRMNFFQGYPRFTRFECKIFLTEAFEYLGGACARGVIDNTHVVVASGTGREMVPVPEMAAFADRFGFKFVAHEVGDADRSGKVERKFHDIENNFLSGRTFTDWNQFNAEARVWCDKSNAAYRKHLHASPRELFAVERTRLRALPAHVPEVYLLHQRIVDSEGFVNVQRNRYSVPWRLIGRPLEVRESKARIEVYQGPRCVAAHARSIDLVDARIIDPAHRPPRGERVFTRGANSPEQKRLRERAPQITEYVALLQKRGHASLRATRTLIRMLDEYPRDALFAAIEEATRYGMTDLDRLERMVLRGILHDFFRPPHNDGSEPHHDKHDEDPDE